MSNLENCIAVKKVLLKSKRPINDQLKKEVFWKYVSYKLKPKRLKGGVLDKRGVELKYSWIARRTGLTYKQVRNLMDRAVKAGIVEKWCLNSSITCRRNFYRLVTWD